MPEPLRLAPLGDSALTLTLGELVAPAVHERVRAWTAALRRAEWPGLREVVPGYAAVSVFYDPTVISCGELVKRLHALATEVPARLSDDGGREIVVPVRYDGPDLAEVAARTGLSPAEVVARHAGRVYRVYLMGFVPGFAYLGELDPALVLPRRETPRQRVPAGSVAIAGAQTAVYPLDTPGGWHLIGQTELDLFDPRREPPALLRPGDRVRFEARP